MLLIVLPSVSQYAYYIARQPVFVILTFLDQQRVVCVILNRYDESPCRLFRVVFVERRLMAVGDLLCDHRKISVVNVVPRIGYPCAVRIPQFSVSVCCSYVFRRQILWRSVIWGPEPMDLHLVLK